MDDRNVNYINISSCSFNRFGYKTQHRIIHERIKHESNFKRYGLALVRSDGILRRFRI